MRSAVQGSLQPREVEACPFCTSLVLALLAWHGLVNALVATALQKKKMFSHMSHKIFGHSKEHQPGRTICRFATPSGDMLKLEKGTEGHLKADDRQCCKLRKARSRKLTIAGFRLQAPSLESEFTVNKNGKTTDGFGLQRVARAHEKTIIPLERTRRR